MVKSVYDWENGAELKPHSLVKHEILSEYLKEYVRVRCAYPQQETFRLVLVDGFSGAGKYNNALGSPLISLLVLSEVAKEINIRRKIEGFRNIKFTFVLVFNDLSGKAISLLKENITPLIAEVIQSNEDVNIVSHFYTGAFEANFNHIKRVISETKITNSIFNLDQYGHAGVAESLLRQVLSVTKSTEIFLTFGIRSLLTFLNPIQISQNLGKLDGVIFSEQISKADLNVNKKEWLAAAELIVFEQFKALANFVSPFSINGNGTWEYWLIHFANSYRARQVYNDILHKKKNSQIHVGRSGLQMMRYSTLDEANLYLFDVKSRESARECLLSDIPSFVRSFGEPLTVKDFFTSTYNETPAHSDDINNALIAVSDLDVITKNGGKRRKPGTIKETDIIKPSQQKTFFFMNNHL